MSTYLTLKPIAISVENVAHSYRAGLYVELDDVADGAAALVAQGRLELVSASEGRPAAAELADEPADDDGEKPLKAHTVPELVDIAKARGASEDSVKNLTKPKLIDVIERLTHVADD